VSSGKKREAGGKAEKKPKAKSGGQGKGGNKGDPLNLKVVVRKALR